MAGILLAKLWRGRPASFVRSDGELFIVSVDGEERTISREVWRLLPEQEFGKQDRIPPRHHHVERSEHGEPKAGVAEEAVVWARTAEHGGILG